MKQNDDIFSDFQKSIEGLKGNFHVLDTSVPVEKQMEYFRYSEDVKKQAGNVEVEDQVNVLNDVVSDAEKKKFAMAFLATTGDVKAYRALEKYAGSLNDAHDRDLYDWSRLSLLQAQIILESEFSDEKQVFISSGLGGKEHRLRFFAFFKANHLIPFSPYQIELIEKEVPFAIRKYGGEIEELTVRDTFFSILLLIDLQMDIRGMLESALNECNQYGNFIDRSFVITNMKKYSDEEILKELNRTNE